VAFPCNPTNGYALCEQFVCKLSSDFTVIPMTAIVSVSPDPSIELLSIFFVRKEFATENDLHTVSYGVPFLLEIHVEVDRAHDAVPELFMDKLLECCNVCMQIVALYRPRLHRPRHDTVKVSFTCPRLCLHRQSPSDTHDEAC
jgi:hypothetical protein